MQRPVVIRGYKTPLLNRQADLHRVLLDVRYRSPNLPRLIQKHLPPTCPKYGMIRTPISVAGDSEPAGSMEMFEHLFGSMFVLSDKNMDVIRHHSARITSISTVLDHLA